MYIFFLISPRMEYLKKLTENSPNIFVILFQISLIVLVKYEGHLKSKLSKICTRGQVNETARNFRDI